MSAEVRLQSSRFYNLNYYVDEIPSNTLEARRNNSRFTASVTFFASLLIYTILMLCLGGLSLTSMIIMVVSMVAGLCMFAFSLWLCSLLLKETRNRVTDAYYKGLHLWNLARASTSLGVSTYNTELLAPFNKYLPSDSVLLRIALTLEHFVLDPFPASLVYRGKMLRDFRPNPSSVFFPISFSGEKAELFCEAFRSDLDAHLAMKDCYRLIHANSLIHTLDFKTISIMPSSMAVVDYPHEKGDAGRKGMVRVYYPSFQENQMEHFPLLAPNERLPQGPLFLAYYDVREGPSGEVSKFPKESVVLAGLEELLQLCLQQRYFFALGWENIYFDPGEEASPRSNKKGDKPHLKIRSMDPEILQEIPECGVVCEALLQWASILGSPEQLAWLEQKLDNLIFDQSLGSEGAKVISKDPQKEDSMLCIETNKGASLEVVTQEKPSLGNSAPQVMLTDYEKECIRAGIRRRGMDLAAYRAYEVAIDGENPHSLSMGGCWEYEVAKMEKLKGFLESSALQNALYRGLPEKLKGSVKISTIRACARWLMEYVREEKNSGSLYKDELMNSLFLGREFILRMTRVLKPGIEPWYSRPDQAQEMLFALQALQYGGYIASVLTTENPERFTILF